MKRFNKFNLAFVVMITLILCLCCYESAFSESPPSKIIFGQALSLSGRFVPQTSNLEQPAISLWRQEVNNSGGLYIREYDMRIPIDVIQYDDKSDVETMLKLTKKLITVDKVDFLLPPHGSDMQFASIPLANMYKQPTVTWTCAIEGIYSKASSFPYVFHAMPDYRLRFDMLKDLLVEVGAKKVAIIYIQGVMGIEISKHLEKACETAGIEIALSSSFPITSPDLSPLLKKVKGHNVDAFVAITYPGSTLLITEQSMVIGLNPKLFFVDIGGAMPMYVKKFGAAKLEGVMSEGGWSPKISPQAQDYFDKFQKLHNTPPDYFSAPYGYAAYQIYGKAIEKAGTLDKDKVRDVMAKETFSTVNGPVKFEGQINNLFPSAIGQWQNGVFEAISPKESMTSKPIYPKPEWQ